MAQTFIFYNYLTHHAPQLIVAETRSAFKERGKLDNNDNVEVECWTDHQQPWYLPCSEELFYKVICPSTINLRDPWSWCLPHSAERRCLCRICNKTKPEKITRYLLCRKEKNFFLTGIWWSQVPQIGLLVMSLVRWYLDNVTLTMLICSAIS